LSNGVLKLKLHRVTDSLSIIPCFIKGDPKQLGPVVKSGLAAEFGLERSPMERLMEFPMYESKKKVGYNPMIITKLLDNYRSHKDLLTIPNEIFYKGELRCCADLAKVSDCEKLTWLPNSNFPILFDNIR